MDQAVAQIVQLGDAVAQLRQKVQNLESDNLELRRRLREGIPQGQGQAGQARDSGKSELRSMKAAYPEKFQPKSDCFRSWADDFERWMKAESPEAHGHLKKAAGAKEFQAMPDGPVSVDLQFAYSHLRKLMGDKDSKNIVRNVRHSNALESYRLLHRRFNPSTAAEKSRALRAVTNFGVTHDNSKIDQVEELIAKFERLCGEYHERYQVHCQTEDSCKDTLRMIVRSSSRRPLIWHLSGAPKRRSPITCLRIRSWNTPLTKRVRRQ